MSTAAIPAVVPPLQWSHWYAYGPEFQASCIPEAAGLCVIGRRHGDSFSIIHLEAACNLSHSFSRMILPDSPVYALLQQEQCFVRYAPIAQLRVRTQALTVIQKWLAEGAGKEKPLLVDELLAGEVFEGGNLKQGA
jgi:hypothetical protein